MATRLSLQMMLEGIIKNTNVYFQPPETAKIKYPCIIYDHTSAKVKYADDKSYIRRKRYQLTIIDRDPDSEIPDNIAELPMCEFERHYTFDNLHHHIYNIYY